jgi:hypothetical protein
VKSVRDEDGEPAGAEITKVEPGSPAARARSGGIEGLVVGDVIWKITLGGRPRFVRNATDFLNLMSPLAEGEKVTLHVHRKRPRKSIVFPRIKLERKKKKGRK